MGVFIQCFHSKTTYHLLVRTSKSPKRESLPSFHHQEQRRQERSTRRSSLISKTPRYTTAPHQRPPPLSFLISTKFSCTPIVCGNAHKSKKPCFYSPCPALSSADRCCHLPCWRRRRSPSRHWTGWAATSAGRSRCCSESAPWTWPVCCSRTARTARGQPRSGCATTRCAAATSAHILSTL